MFLNRFEALNLALLQKMRHRRAIAVAPTPKAAVTTPAATATVVAAAPEELGEPAGAGGAGGGGGAKKKKSKKPTDEDSEEADEDKAVREIMVNMKCLHIAQCMLQNVQCDLEENVHLVTMLNNLVVPAVRSQEAPIRERGLVCLGLCCVLGKVSHQRNSCTH